MPEKMLNWNCEKCGSLLGRIEENLETLQIKIRDVYLWITGGEITMTCRKCGTMNQLSQSVQTPFSEIKSKAISDKQ